MTVPHLILAMEQRWIALFKPAGLPVFAPHNDPQGDCLLARLFDAVPSQKEGPWPSGFAGGIAHRLDIPTSGQVIVARTPSDLRWIRELFSTKQLHKQYGFLTAKTVGWSSHVIAAPIAHDRRRKGRMVVQRGNSTPHRGKWLSAQTHFTRISPVGVLTAWQAEMQTGVMHQIRVHAGFAGLALAGDRRYGGGQAHRDFPVDFALHHRGLHGPGLHPPPAPLPSWWPVLIEKWPRTAPR